MSLLSRALVPRASGIAKDLEKRVFQSSVFATATTGEDQMGMYTHLRDEQALRLIAVYACVRIIADQIASLPFASYQPDENGAPIQVPVQPPVIANPGGTGVGDPTNFEFWHQIVTSLALTGNAYAVVMRRDYRQYPLQLFPVHPYAVEISRNIEDGKADYRVGQDIIPRYDMLHIKRFQLANKLTGTSPIGVAAQGIGLGLSSERFGARYFVDAASPSSVLESDLNIPPDTANSIVQNWIATHGGRRYPAILSGGLKYRQITISPEESQFLQTRRFQRSEIAMLFGVPPHMIGDVEKSTSWGTGIEQQSTGFVMYNLRPWLVCLEHAFNRLTPRGQFSLFDADALLRGDQQSRWAAYEAGRRAGVYSVNDILRKEAMPLIGPEGDMRLQPMNYIPLGTGPDQYPAVLAAEAAQGIDPETGEPFDGLPKNPNPTNPLPGAPDPKPQDPPSNQSGSAPAES